jgi:plastocyanin
MDRILDLAAQQGIQVQLVLNDHGLFREGLNWQWNAYNDANGGPVPEARPWEFFTSPAARDAFKHRLRYLVARYGAYSNVLAWELFNEIQFVGSDAHNPLNDPAVATAVQDWHAEMSGYLRQIDPYRHLITTSSDVAGGFTDPIWREPSMDLVQVHDYHAPFDTRNEEMRDYITEVQTTYGKPVIFGEFGSSDECGFDPTTYPGSTVERDHLTEGTFVHNGAWTAAMSASGAMTWWWGCYMAADAAAHRDPPQFPLNESIFPALTAFLDGEDGGTRHMRPAGPTASSQIKAFALADTQHALLWVRDSKNERGTGFGPGDIAPTRMISGATVSLPGMANGQYAVEIWSPYGAGGKIGDIVATASAGVLYLDVPDFQRDLALKVSRSATAPGAPSGVTAAAGDAQASVSWAAPSSDGGSQITSYTVTASPGGRTTSVAANVTTAMVTGLTNGTLYTFTVTGTNDVGTGPVSDPSDPVTPQAGAPSPQSTEETVPPTGGTATTDPTNAGPSPADPVTTSVTVPATSDGGSVMIAETAVNETPPSGGYQFVGQQIDITSTAATSASNPLTVVFTIDSSVIRAAFGLGPGDPLPAADQLNVTRAEGTGAPSVIASCTTPSRPIDPDPCIPSREYINGGDDLQITVLTSTASHWNTAIKPVAAIVTNSGYSPKAATVAFGSAVVWTFAGSKPHSATDNLKLGAAKAPLFNSGPLITGRYGYVFRAAGTYTYSSTVKGDPGAFAGSIGVPVRVTPTSGATTTLFTVTWSSSALPGYVFDVQYRFMKAGTKSWSGSKPWQTGVSTTSAGFVPPSGKGSYAFSARLRNATTGMASLWSPEVVIVVR